MSFEDTKKKEMSALERSFGIFFIPKKTFESINRKPTFIVPFIITTVVIIIFSVSTMDIRIKDKIAKMKAYNIPQEQIELAESDIGNPTKYYIIPFIPVSIFMNWAIWSGLIFFVGNKLMKGNVKFEKIYSAIAWSSLIGISCDNLIRMIIILLKGTTHGITTSLAIFLPTPQIGHGYPIIYKILSEFNLFTIWQIILMIIGFTIIYNFNKKKSAILTLSVWAPLILIKVALHVIIGDVSGL